MSDQQNLNLVYITSLMDEILDSIIMAIDTCPMYVLYLLLYHPFCVIINPCGLKVGVRVRDVERDCSSISVRV